MPFTFSHPAAALPLLRRLGPYGSASALIVGSTTPDLGFVVNLGLTRAQTHSAAGLLLFCLPAGLCALLLFHTLLKVPLLQLFPASARGKLAPLAGPGLPPWPAMLVSLLCGTLTHLAWDAFTHPHTPVVEAIGVLAMTVGSVGGMPVHLYNVLQHVSSIAGLAVLALWWRRWLRAAPCAAVPPGALAPALRMAAAAAIVTLPLAVGLAMVLRQHAMPANGEALRALVATFMFSTLPALSACVGLYCAAWWAWQRARTA